MASIRQGRNHLLIGEPGVGKRTLLAAQFREAFPPGGSSPWTARARASATDGGPELPTRADGRPQLLLLRGLNLLGPVGGPPAGRGVAPVASCCRRRRWSWAASTPPAMDATRPYGLLLRHFHEITRIPPLRYRADEIGEIAWSSSAGSPAAGRCG